MVQGHHGFVWGTASAMPCCRVLLLLLLLLRSLPLRVASARVHVVVGSLCFVMGVSTTESIIKSGVAARLAAIDKRLVASFVHVRDGVQRVAPVVALSDLLPCFVCCGRCVY